MISKATGVTASERYLADLCERTFLRLWSYPNVFRDQGKTGSGDGKEVCDLLVVCGKDVVVFSDKSCAFPNTGNLDTDWCRWFRRSVIDSARQVYGAERWIRQFPNRLFLDPSCSVPFALQLDDPSELRFHRIVVALNAKERCAAQVGGRGSLFLYPAVAGDAHVDRDARRYYPIHVGLVDPAKEFVHVFDDVTLDIILRELDTVTDLLDYLNKKEDFIRRGGLEFAPGEENLLALYLANINDKGEHDFVLPKGADRILVRGDSWSRFVSSPEYRAKQNADRISYFWDRIIQLSAGDAMSGNLIPGSARSLTETEQVLRLMALERRMHRRSLSAAFLDRIERTGPKSISRRLVKPQHSERVAYAFVCHPLADPADAERRRFRRDYLIGYCLVCAWANQEYEHIVGIATESGINTGRSFDLALVSIRDWTPELVARVKTIQDAGEFLIGSTITHVSNEEYPD
jgi:hypothetical protein